MSAISTYVFFDLETTGLPKLENNKTKITELTFIAVKRIHLLEADNGLPRVQNKLTLCFNPQKMIQLDSTRLTGLSNELLEYEAPFNTNTVTLLNSFLERLTQPICLIAYNGNKFDFPILKKHLEKFGDLPIDILCADSYECFYELTSCKQTMPSTSECQLDMKLLNENTPKKQIVQNTQGEKCRKKLSFSEQTVSKESFKLPQVYERLLDRPAKDTHTAEALLILTGMVWGCTNPFIRMGTRGIRNVRANNALGLAVAELMFLIKNWKYMVPWLINQAGSLLYVMVVQNVPLSLAVPAANSLAFAFTALTGSAIGSEKPLDKHSIMGITLITLGTAICCWDKT